MWFKYGLLIFGSFLIVSVVNVEVKEIDRNDIDVLLKNASIKSLRVYAELPDADNFMIDDAYVHSPVKFVNYSSYLTSFFSGWDEAELNRLYPKTTLVFGDLRQAIGKGERTEASTNLRRFLKFRDDYIEESTASFRMPRFLRELIDMPTVLNCDYMLDKLNDVRFDFYLNYENYIPLKTLDDFDRFVCALKGEGKVFMISDEDTKSYFEANEDESKMKKVKYHEFELKTGQCLFVPSTMTSFLKTNYLWVYTVNWKYINKPVDYKMCYPNLPPRVGVKDKKDKEEEKNKKKNEEDEDEDDEDDGDEPSPMAYHRKISQFTMTTDADQANFEKTINYLTHFLEYLKDTQSALNQIEFVNKIKKDKKVVKSGFDCDNECNRLIKKAFIEVDIDKDESFQIDDFENLDLDTALELNKKLSHDLKYMHSKDKKDTTWSFDEDKKKSDKPDTSKFKKPYTINLGGVDFPIDLEPIEKILETLTKVKGLLSNAGMMGNVKNMAFDKIKEFMSNLPADKRSKIEKVDFKELYDVFISLTGVEDFFGILDNSGKSQRSGDKKKPAAAKKDDSIFENDDVKHANKYHDDDDEEEIAADEDHKQKSTPKEDL